MFVMVFFALVLGLCLTSADGRALRANMRLVDSVQTSTLAAQGWSISRTTSSNQTIALQIGIEFAGESALIARLQEVSDPVSPKYGHYLSRSEVNTLAQPSLVNLEKVQRWLLDNDISPLTYSDNGHWVSFRTTIAKANEVLGADFREYENKCGGVGSRKVRTVEYSVPEDVSDVVDVIYPTTFFGRTEAWDMQTKLEVNGKQWVPLLSWLVPVLLGTEGHSKRDVAISESVQAKEDKQWIPLPSWLVPVLLGTEAHLKRDVGKYPPWLKLSPDPGATIPLSQEERDKILRDHGFTIEPSLPLSTPRKEGPRKTALKDRNGDHASIGEQVSSYEHNVIQNLPPPRPRKQELRKGASSKGRKDGKPKKHGHPKHANKPQGSDDRKSASDDTQAELTCDKAITPKCLKRMYNIGNYKPNPSSGSRVGFGSFLNETASWADIEQFKKMFGVTGTIEKDNVNRAKDDQSSSRGHGESNLDAQILLGLVNGLPVTEFLTGGSPPIVPDLDVDQGQANSNEPYVPYYQHLLSLNDDKLPQVISNSYGEPERTVPINYAKRTCLMIAMLGLRGVTVFHSSEDTGVGSGCVSNDGRKTPEFPPMFPASCPWVTAVGGTEGSKPEIAWKDSSGGFSNYFGRPWYQREAVGRYLDERLSKDVRKYYKPYFNESGRGFPDISAHSTLPPYAVVVNNRLVGSGGTSAASPVWAAITALLNDARLRAKKPTMGFINPWLYAHGRDLLTDIKNGSTRGCDGTNHQTGKKLDGAGKIKWASWNGTEGWDPATGLGMPDFGKMREAALKM